MYPNGINCGTNLMNEHLTYTNGFIKKGEQALSRSKNAAKWLEFRGKILKAKF